VRQPSVAALIIKELEEAKTKTEYTPMIQSKPTLYVVMRRKREVGMRPRSHLDIA